MDHVDSKFIGLLSPRLEQFKKVKGNLYNFRCPICGDSKKNKNKTRGYLYQVKTNTNFKCHNCGINISFNNFLKDLDPSLYKEYVFEKFKDGHTGKNFVTTSPEEVFKNFLPTSPNFKKKVLIDLPSAFEVSKPREYLYARGIFEGDFYYAHRFQEFVNTLKPGFFENTEYHDERIDIPLIKDGTMVGLQGSGKTTTAAKIASRLTRRDKKKVLMASLDVTRPAAREQLRVLGEQIEVSTLPIAEGETAVSIAKRAMTASRLQGYDVVILDTAGTVSYTHLTLPTILLV